MQITRITTVATLSLLIASCGPGEEPKTPAGEPTAAPEPASDTATVSFMGVDYDIDAEPVSHTDGWGVHVTVTARITDGQDHAFVQDTMYSDEGPVALRFTHELGDETLAEPSYTGSMDLVTASADAPLTLERTYPSPEASAASAGETLELTVGIWGTEDAAGGQRYAPDLARITLAAGDPPELTLTTLDPSADLPRDFISWEIGSHKLVIKPFYPNKQIPVATTGEGVAVYKVGETVVRIKSSKLVVDDMFYGELPGGSGILVDHGQVAVDGKDRTGEEMTKKELLEYHDVPRSEHELAGHKIVISPGAVKFGTVSVGDEHRIVLDDREVVIENEILHVDGVCYGEIKPKAKIKIFFDEVTVGKKTLEPTDC